MDLFEQQAAERSRAMAPLAERMRPATLDGFVGQDHLTEADGLIRQALERGRLFSMILWGPPGCGKTTLARILASATDSYFVQLSAVTSGIKDVRQVVDQAVEQRNLRGRKTLLFVDEIHRFNKAQQDGFLPHVESGLITLIGATTENPSFEVIAPLLSRCRVLTLNPLSAKACGRILDQALADQDRGLAPMSVTLSPEARDALCELADGDARRALNTLELAAFLADPDTEGTRRVTEAHVAQAAQKRSLVYDKAGDEHYNLISAFHKSLRGSDPDAALYWLERMLAGGEDPLYLARRMVRCASEDIGNAAPQALVITMAATGAYQLLGSPDGELALAQAAVYLATAPKSNAVYMAQKKARDAVAKTGSLPVPLHIRNAPTRLMKDSGYAKGYQYPHDFPDAFVNQQYLPDKLASATFYFPTDRGYEKTVNERLATWRRR